MTDHREYIARRLLDPQGELTIWGKSILQAYSRVAKLSFVPVIELLRESEFLVLGAKIFNQLSQETQNRAHLIMTARDLLRCRRIPRSLTYDLKSYDHLYSLIENDDKVAYDVCRRHAERILRRTRAKVVIANSTIDPINRLWLKVARDLGLKTACVQHGVYSDAIPMYVLEEDIIDRYVALDEGQSAILQKNIAKEKIVVLGMKENFIRYPSSGIIKICFVGEDWERYGFEEIKIEITKKYLEIFSFLKINGCKKFCYKRHPSEFMLNGIDKSMEILKYRDFNTPDVYIGFSSTLLKEMSSQGKLAIQLLDEKTHAERFQSLGYCLTINNDNDAAVKILRVILSTQVVPFIRNHDLEGILFK